MSDISQCDYKECPKSNSCYRFLAIPNPQYQSYMRFENICNSKNNFQWYWETKQEIIKEEGENKSKNT